MKEDDSMGDPKFFFPQYGNPLDVASYNRVACTKFNQQSPP